MARRLGKRKQQDREDYMLKEVNKVEGGIFDRKTMVALSKFYNKGIIETLNFIIARGKEADVYIAEPGTSDAVKGMKVLILKFFRIETSSFYKMADYMLGDPRFSRISKQKYSIVREWCKKEFGNLEIARKAGVHAPRPIMFNSSILAMTFIGTTETNIPAPQLKDAKLVNPTKTLDLILKDIELLYNANLVHADVSEYNILMKGNIPYMIDFGQAVVLRHPNALTFLRRDVENITHYFKRKYGVERDSQQILKDITGKTPQPKTSE